MDNYEVNVLTRKGGWKKLQQEIDSPTVPIDKNKDNSIVKNESIDFNLNTNNEKNISNNSVFHNFDTINQVIGELQNLENEKDRLIEKLDVIQNSFINKKEDISSKLDKVTKEYELYEKAIKLIGSLKNI